VLNPEYLCPLYALRPRTWRAHLRGLANDNAQRQDYLTRIVESIRRSGGDVRTITTTFADSEYDLACADVTRRQDLAPLGGILQLLLAVSVPPAPGLEQAALPLPRGPAGGHRTRVWRSSRQVGPSMDHSRVRLGLNRVWCAASR